MMRAHPDTLGGKPESPSAAPPTSAYQGDLASGLAPPEHVDPGAPPPPEPPAPEPVAVPPPPPEAPYPSDPASAPAEAAASPATPPSEAMAAAGASATHEGAAAATAPATGAPSIVTTKDLHGWLRNHRRKTQRSLEWAETWCASLPASRRRS
jgi:hypothetical protein